MATDWNNRITGHGEADPEQLMANPLNWRIHPSFQQKAVQEVIEDVGWVSDVLVNENTGNIIDGHLRVMIAMKNNQPTVPVRYTDLTEEEERKILATLDPLAELAVTDQVKLDELLQDIGEIGDGSLNDLLASLGSESWQTSDAFGEPDLSEFEGVDDVQVKYRVVVEDLDYEEADGLLQELRQKGQGNPQMAQYRVGA